MPLEYLLQAVVWEDCNSAVTDRQHIVFEAFERVRVKIGKVAGDMKLGDLSLATLKIFASSHPAVEQYDAGIEMFARSNGNRICRQLACFGDGVADRPLLVRADLGTLTQPLQMNGDHSRTPCATTRQKSS
jgi:hypothetical protein